MYQHFIHRLKGSIGVDDLSVIPLLFTRSLKEAAAAVIAVAVITESGACDARDEGLDLRKEVI